MFKLVKKVFLLSFLTTLFSSQLFSYSGPPFYTDLSPVDEALLTSAMNGDMKKLRNAIKSGASLEATNYQGSNALILAAENNHTHIVKELLLYGVEVNFKNDYGTTVLTTAAWNGNFKLVKFLLSQDADIHHQSYYGTPLTLATQQNYTELAIFLLNKGAKADERIHEGLSALMFAAQNGNHTLIFHLLERGAVINAYTVKTGKTALIFATENNHTYIAEQLILNGADVNQQLQRNDTALVKATFNNNEEMISILLKYDADVNQSISNSIEENLTPLMIAAQYGYTNIAKILIDFDAKIDAYTSFTSHHPRWTALLFASAHSHNEMVELLLNHGADIKDTHRKNYNALSLAIEKSKEENIDLVQTLIHFGADVNQANIDGRTPLILATLRNDIRTVKALLTANANRTTKDEAGFTALYYATQKDLSEISELLRTFFP